MHRAFELTLPNTDEQNLFTLMSAVTGAVPTDGVLPDRVNDLSLKVRSGTVTLGDRNSANAGGSDFGAGEGITKRSGRNTICLRDYTLTGAAGGEVVEVDVESI